MRLIPWWLKALAVALVVGALVAACNHRDDTLVAKGRAEQLVVDQAAADRLKAEAVATLATETARVAKAEEALRAFKDQQEIKDADNRKVIDAQGKRLSALAGSAGRLRDPHQTDRCGGRGSSATSPQTPASGVGGNDTAQGTGLLSKELSGLLQRLMSEADVINVAYVACRADGEAIRAAP